MYKGRVRLKYSISETGGEELSFQILPNDKFAVVALVHASTANFPVPLNLGDGLWVLRAAPIDVGQRWREWIGSVNANEIVKANLWFVAIRPSKAPEVLDQENEDLKDEVWYLFLGLLMIGSPHYEGGYLLTGAHVHGGTEVRQYVRMNQYIVSYGGPHLVVDQPEIRLALTLKAGLRTAYGKGTTKRIKRGISVFLKGLEETFAEARLHQFVRSVEAIVKPSPPGIKSKMVERCRTFVGATNPAETVIKDCYELRSKEEHLLDWQDALLHYSQNQRENILFQRVRQIEGLARYVYQRILTSAHHMSEFEDSAIDGFWNLSEPDRVTRWGTPLNIAAIS